MTLAFDDRMKKIQDDLEAIYDREFAETNDEMTTDVLMMGQTLRYAACTAVDMNLARNDFVVECKLWFDTMLAAKAEHDE